MAPESESSLRELYNSSLSVPIRSAVLVTLLLLATFYTAYLAAPIVIPITAALLLNFLFAPIVGRLAKWGVPRTAGAFLIVSLLVAGIVAPMFMLAEPAGEWLRSAPTSLADLGRKFRSDSSALANVREVSDALEEAVGEITGSQDDQTAPPAVSIEEPGLLDSTLQLLPMIAVSAVVTLILTLFLLISGDRLLRKVTSLGSDFAMRRRIVLVARQTEREIARYLGTVTLVNIALGAVVGLAMSALNVPNPLLWGTIAGVLNFAPYLGPALTAFLILVASATSFDSPGQIALPPIVFLLLTSIEGSIITPLLLGRRLELSPVVVFLSVLILGYLWGLVGALMAVPIVSSIRIALINTPRLEPLGRLLAR